MAASLGSTVLRLAAVAALASVEACGGKATEPPPPVTWEGPGTGTVGAGGGAVALTGGPHLAIPAGALAADTAITVTAATGQLPGALTPVFQFEPDGTTFAAPATVTFAVPAGTTTALLVWSALGGPDDFEKIPVQISGGTARAQVGHFSMGYLVPGAVSSASPPSAQCPPKSSNPCAVGRWDDTWLYGAHCVYDAFAADGTACWPLGDHVVCGVDLPCLPPPVPTNGPTGVWQGGAHTPWDGHCVAGSCKSPPYHRISGTLHGDQPPGGAAVVLDGYARSGTTASGPFVFSSLVNGSYSLTPKAPGYTFTPPVRTVSIFNQDVGGQDFTARADVHRVSGTVSGAVAAGVSVTLTGAASFGTATDADGHYAFDAVPDGLYTATPQAPGYRFEPPSRTATVNGAHVDGVDFTSQRAGHSFSGTVSGAVQTGVTVALAGPSTAATTTDALGHYAFAGLSDGAYTATPTLAGYAFAPASRTAAVAGLDVSGQDFTASIVAGTHLTWGYVSGAVLSGVTITLYSMPSGVVAATAVTGADGSWSLRVPDGHYDAVPSLAGYAFEPQGLGFSVSGADFGGFTFTARRVPRWEAVASGTDVDLFAVGGSGPGDVWAVGAGGITLHWDGAAWSLVPSPTIEPLYAIWSTARVPNSWPSWNPWVVGAQGTLLHWVELPGPPAWSAEWSSLMDGAVDLRAIWGSGAPYETWVVGDHRTTRYWGPSDTWAQVANPLADPRSGLNAVWGSGPGDVWAVGGDDPAGTQSRVLHWNGTAWSEVAHPNQQMLRALWGSGPSDVWAAGSVGGALLHWDGSAWAEGPGCGLAFVHGLWGSGPLDAWLVGFDDLARKAGLCHWDGATWEPVESGSSAVLRGVWGSGSGEVWAVGERGTILRWIP
jgi:hypothetical protein